MVQSFLLRLVPQSKTSVSCVSSSLTKSVDLQVTTTKITKIKSSRLKSQLLIMANLQSPRVSRQGFNCCTRWTGGLDTCIVILALPSEMHYFAESSVWAFVSSSGKQGWELSEFLYNLSPDLPLPAPSRL